ncbi:MAG: hypothetical protein CMN30_34195 [Sandaracinus sp.]|nr:hypothetical protein [Sandaracinus sp.]
MSALLLAAQVLAVLTGTADARALVTDPGGTVWVGTTGGLVRAEGDSTEVYTPRDGLPDGTVRSLLRKGPTLWVGTDRGVARCRPDASGLHVQAVVGAGLRVEALAIHAGHLYLGTTTGLFEVREAEVVPHGPSGRVTALASAGGDLYLTRPGRGTYRLQGERLRRLRGDRFAWDLAADGDDLWIATSAGLEHRRAGRRRRDRVERASRDIPARDLRSVRLQDGQPVVGSLGGGAWRYSRGRFHALDTIPPGARVQTLTLGPEGWLAGTPDGVVGAGAPANGGPFPDNDLSALAQTDEGLWVGTFDHGLVLLRGDGTHQRFDETRGLLDDRINRLAVDDAGSLWVATDRGVVQRQGEGFVLRGLLDRHVFALGFAAGAIHAGAGDTVVRFGDGGDTELFPPGARPQDFGGAANLVVATAEGLVQATPDGWALLTSDDGLEDDWVTAVASGPDGLYLGTYASGVARLSGGRVETLRDDLWVNAGALVAVGSSLALGTLDDGLWLYAGERWTQLDTAAGLPDDDVTAVLPAADGTLWVATRGGLARVAL